MSSTLAPPMTVGRFRLLRPNMWWLSPVAQRVVAAAKKRTAEADRQSAPRFESEARWQGYIGERGLSAWLDALEVPHRRNGGVDGRPDLEIHGAGVAVKTTGHSGSFRPSYWCPYPKAQLDAHRFDEVFWCGFLLDADYPALTLLGGMSTDEFLDRAEVVKKGETMESGRKASYDFYRVQAADLQTPINWLCRLDLAAAETKEA